MNPIAVAAFLLWVAQLPDPQTSARTPRRAGAALPAGTITTLAGPMLPVEGALAIEQALDWPHGVTSDRAGGFYLASHNRVYRVITDGTIHVVAGTGTSGFSGDGGSAASARLNNPYNLATDAAGNLYVNDSGNARIRKVTPGGLISTVAGTGSSGFSGDGGPATAARIFTSGIVVDSAGALILAEGGSFRVRKVTPGGIISTIAGNGVNSFRARGSIGDGGSALAAPIHPAGIAADRAGNLYVSDSGRIRKITPGGVITTIAGNGTEGFSADGGTAAAAQLRTPQGIAVDPSGNLYFADNDRIRKVTTDGVIHTVAGGGSRSNQDFSGQSAATSVALSDPTDIAIDAAGSIYFTEPQSNRIVKVLPDGTIRMAAGKETTGFGGDDGPATSALMNSPQDIAVDAAGNVYIADVFNKRVRKVTPDGIIRTVAGGGNSSDRSGPGTSVFLEIPQALAVDTNANLYIASGSLIYKLTPDGMIRVVAGSYAGGATGDGGPATSARLLRPEGIVVDAAGNIFISDEGASRVRKVTVDGVIHTVAGGGTSPGDGAQATSAQLSFPKGVAVDSAGNLYIAESNRVRKVSPDGIIGTIITQTGLTGGIAVDKADNLYVVTSSNNRVLMMAPGGSLRAVAGNGHIGFSGDGGPAIEAEFTSPHGVAVDTAGNLFISDSTNNRVRKVTGGSR